MESRKFDKAKYSAALLNSPRFRIKKKINYCNIKSTNYIPIQLVLLKKLEKHNEWK